VFAGVMALVLVPFAALAPHALLATIEDQARRPLQIESLGAAGLVAAHHLVGAAVQMDSTFGSQNLVGGAAHTLGGLQTGLQAAALVALWLWFAARLRSNRELVAAAAGAVAVFVAFGKVLSPQFLIWLIPLVPLVRGRRGLVASALLLAALVLTQLWFPQRYWDYALRFAPAESWLVLARDLVLVALAVVLAVRFVPRRLG
jgi:Mannosyltransferase (PIG-M)